MVEKHGAFQQIRNDEVCEKQTTNLGFFTIVDRTIAPHNKRPKKEKNTSSLSNFEFKLKHPLAQSHCKAAIKQLKEKNERSTARKFHEGEARPRDSGIVFNNVAHTMACHAESAKEGATLLTSFDLSFHINTERKKING